MVDAVSAVNAAINTIVQQRKDVSINWKDLSAKEVLDHAGKGEDVPLEVLKWAEDYAKLEDVPDDVSYDAVNGANERDEVIENSADTDSVYAEDVKSEAAEESDEVNETEEGEAEPENDEDLNSPEALYQQGATMLQESNTGTKNVNDSVAASENQVKLSQQNAEEAGSVAEETVSRVKSQKSEYDNLVNKITSDKSKIEVSDLNKLDKLSKNLDKNGTRAQAKLNVYDMQIQAIETEFAQYREISTANIGVGESTTEIGNKLIDLVPPEEREDQTSTTNENGIQVSAAVEEQRSNYQFVFNRYYAMGRSDTSAGSTAQSVGENGVNSINNNLELNKEAETLTREAQDKVEDSTMVKGETFTSAGNDKENEKEVAARDKEQKLSRNSTGNKTDLNGVKDSSLLSDNLELQRRKEARGEQPPPQTT